MIPAEIPRPQSQRVALFVQQFGKFDSGKNAYWSLRKGRPVTLVEGAAFDRQYKAGLIAPPAHMATLAALARPGSPLARVFVRPDVAPAGPPPMQRWQEGYRKAPPIAPQEKFTTMPIEAVKFAKLPAAPPPGPARPPAEPLFDAVMRTLRERQVGPATEVIATRPAFAMPGRSLVDAGRVAEAGRAPAMAVAGLDMKKLILPAVLIAGAFVVSKML